MRIVFATGNKDKMFEIREIMSDVCKDSEIISMKEAGIDADIEENGTTFEENALIKASEVFKLLRNTEYADAIVLSDDSGIEVDCLNKEPGIYSARYMGKDTSYDIKNADLIRRVNETGDKDRTARFVCTVAACYPDGTSQVVRGTIEGAIAFEPKGKNGFGFDPIFFVPELGVTTAELEPSKKHEISHRGRALRMIKEEILKHENSCN